MPTSAECRRRGISLLEAVVGLAIVGVVAIAALNAAAAEQRAVARARHAIEAAALARHRLQVLDLLTRDELMSLPDSIARGQFPPPFDDRRWITTVTPREGEQGVYDVTLQVAWADGAYTTASALYRQPLVVTAQ